MPPKHQKTAASAPRDCTGMKSSLRRTTRAGNKQPGKNATYDNLTESESEEASEEGESASDGDVEDEDAEEPDTSAPSRSARHKRGHQTGLSLSLSKTDIANTSGRKRAYSTSSEDTVTARPRKLSRSGKYNESNNQTSDDDAYNAVDNISDSDVEDTKILKGVESQNIIESEEENEYAEFVLDEEMNDSAFAEQFARTEVGAISDFYSSEAFNDTSAATAEETPARRVRFAGIDSSSSNSSSSTDFDAAFPDLLGQDLDYNSYQQIDFIEDDDEDEQSSDGYWELDPNNPYAEEDRMLMENGFRDEEGSSGYETDSDAGTTTEEEPEPLHSVSAPKKMLELRSTSPLPEGTRPRRLAMPRNRPVTGSQKRGPVLGTWIADPSKPIAVVDKSGRVKYYSVQTRSYDALGSTMSSADSSPQRSYVPLARPPSSSSINQFQQITSNVTSQATSPGTIGDFIPSDAFLPLEFDPSAFFDDFDDDDEDEIENSLNIDDLIDFGDDSESEEEDNADESVLQTPAKTPTTQKLPKITPKQSAGRPSSHNLLEHFDRGVVSAFRRNQNRAQSVTSRLPIGSLFAIKGGRHTAASNPISPLRKRKASRSMSQSSSAAANGPAIKRRLTNSGTRHRQNTL